MVNIAEKLTKIRLPRTNPRSRPAFIRDLPETAGVYVFYKGRKVVYIGKAVNLKRRIASYFDLDLETKTARMVSEASGLGVLKVNSELEALLLEARLIRLYMPHYNIAAKDDKHPLYIVVTREKYPRVITARRTDLEKESVGASFGPFPSSANVKSVLRMIRRVFPFSDHKLGKRGCLYSHIGLCSPCPSEILKIARKGESLKNQKKYSKNIQRVRAVLSGKLDVVKAELAREMQFLSKEERYEEAADLRNKIESLDYITRKRIPADFYIQNPNLYEDQRRREIKELAGVLESLGLVITGSIRRVECFDVAHLAGSAPTASMVTFIGGEPEKSLYRHFKLKKAKGGDDYDSMREVAERRSARFKEWGKPDLIIVDGGAGQVKSFATDVPVVGIAKNPDRLVYGGSKTKLSGGALNFVGRMRDEAHRFARRYHHALISKELRINENAT